MKPVIILEKGNQYSITGLQPVVRQAIKRAGIKSRLPGIGSGAIENIPPYSAATRLLESATDLRHIQEFPGHASSKTIGIFNYVSTESLQNIQSLCVSMELMGKLRL